MKALFITILLAVLSLPAAPLTQAERDKLLAQLEKSSRIFLAAIEGVSDAQWSYKSAPDRWSVGECAEHVAISDEMMFAFVSLQLMKMPPPAEPKPRPDEAIVPSATDRTNKVKTQPFLEPKGKYATRAAVIEAFHKTRGRIVDYVKSTQDDLRGHGFQAANGYVDGYQFLLTLSGHEERHSEQIAEVKASVGYPKK